MTGFRCQNRNSDRDFGPASFNNLDSAIQHDRDRFGGNVNFIERIFDVSPDGGSGSLEVVCIVAILAILTAPLIVPRILNFIRRSQAALVNHN